MSYQNWDDVWFGTEDERILVRKYTDGLFHIAISLGGKTNIDEMVSICIVDDEIPFLISALKYLLVKERK